MIYEKIRKKLFKNFEFEYFIYIKFIGYISFINIFIYLIGTMNETSSLILLADIALDKSNSLKYKYKNTKQPKTKVMRVHNIDGKKYADISNLKNTPISILFKVFFEQYEDTNLHCTVFVCKYDVKNICNTQFMDIKNNKINQLEHLAFCHLLEHLTKTKSGSFIEIPEMSKSFQKQISSTFIPSKKVKTIVCQKDSTLSNPENSVKNEILENFYSKNVCNKLQENLKTSENQNYINKTNDNYEISYSTNLMSETLQVKDELPETPVDDVPSNFLNLVNREHDYSCNTRKCSDTILNNSKKLNYDGCNLDINNLCYFNNEPSQDLIDFMLKEILYYPKKTFTLEGNKLIIQELPLVGSEVEVTTSHNIVRNHDDVIYQNSAGLQKYKLNIEMKKHSTLKYRNLKTLDKNIPIKECQGEDIKKDLKRRLVSEENNNDLVVAKENYECIEKLIEKNEKSLLKVALLKNAGKQPIINISNVLNNFKVHYI